MRREHPRISVLKLAEYMGAHAVRRRSIIRDQQAPPDPIVPYYRRAIEPAVRFLRGGATDIDGLIDAAAELKQIMPTSRWHRTDLRNSAEALTHLIHVMDQIDLGKRIVGGRRSADILWLGSVEVSIRPHVVFVKETPAGLRVGALKLAFAKSREIPEQEAGWAATLMRRALEERLEEDASQVEPGLCQVVDVFRERIYTAPKAFKRTMQLAEAACDEVHRMWPGQSLQLPQRPWSPPPGPAPLH